MSQEREIKAEVAFKGPKKGRYCLGLSFATIEAGKMFRTISRRTSLINAARTSGHGVTYCLKTFAARANVRTQC